MDEDGEIELLVDVLGMDEALLPDDELVAGCDVVVEFEVGFCVEVCACSPSAAAKNTDAPQVMNTIGFFMVFPDSPPVPPRVLRNYPGPARRGRQVGSRVGSRRKF